MEIVTIFDVIRDVVFILCVDDGVDEVIVEAGRTT